MAPRLGKEGLTVKQRKLVKAVAEGKTLVEAAREAEYSGSDETVRVEAHRTLRKPHVAQALEAALDKAGMTLQKQAQIVAEAGDAEDVAMTKEGEVVTLGPDHTTRLKAAELAGKWRGLGREESEGGAVMGVGFFVLKGIKERGLTHLESQVGEISE